MKKWIAKHKGLTQVEFLLIALALMLVIFSIIEFALYFYSIQMANEVTRRAARLATVCYIADRDDIKALPSVENLYPPGFTADNLEISYLKEVEVDGSLQIIKLTEAEVALFSSATADTNSLNQIFTHIRYVKAEADYTFRFFVLSLLLDAVGVSPKFETILPAESLGILRPEGGGVREDCGE